MLYTDEEMKKMVKEYNLTHRSNKLGELYNNRKEFIKDFTNVSHQIKKLEFSGNEVYGEFETVVSPAYERTDVVFTTGDKLDFSLKNHRSYNVIFVISDDKIHSIDIELEPIRDFEI